MSDNPESLSPTNSQARTIAAYWDNAAATQCPGWWAHPQIVRHVNARVFGRPLDGFSRGLTEKALEMAGGRVFERGIAVGCGIGAKEMNLVDAGLVRSFILYELSPARIEQGRSLAAQRGLADRVEFCQEDAFKTKIADGGFDFIHWNNSLHHMMDTEAAVAWSFRILRIGGMFYLDDFIGPSRFQWSGKALAFCSAIRASLPERYLANPKMPNGRESVQVKRPSRLGMIRSDPSEAADSSQILNAVRRYFPDAWIRPTGGVVYNCALARLIQNFNPNDPDDSALLESLLEQDDAALEIPGIECHYSVALALKGTTAPSPRPDGGWLKRLIRKFGLG